MVISQGCEPTFVAAFFEFSKARNLNQIGARITEFNKESNICSLTQVPPCDNSDCIVLYGEQWRRGPEPTRLRSLRDPGRPGHRPGPHNFRTPILPNHLCRCHCQTYHNIWPQSVPYMGQLFIVTAGKKIKIVVLGNAKQQMKCMLARKKPEKSR